MANAEYTNRFVNGTKWEVSYSSCEPGSETTYSTFSLEEEQTIAGHRCWKYYRDGEMLCYVYTEGDKVYGIRPDAQLEDQGAEAESLLIYDFGLTVGDTVCVAVFKDYYYGESDRHSKQVCVGEGLITSCGRTYEYLEMKEVFEGFEDLPLRTNYWVKGLGGILSIRSDFANWGYDMDGGGGWIESITSYNNTLYSNEDKVVIARLVTPPANLAKYDVDFYSDFVACNCGSLRWSGQMGFDGQDVYIQGLCTGYPQAWIKGTLTDDGSDGQQQVIFESPQYIGYIALTGINEQASGPVYFTDAQLGPNVTMTWDAATRTLKCTDRFLENWKTEEVCFLEMYNGVTITPKDLVHIAAPASVEDSTDAIYNIYGTRVEGSAKGLIIRNGRIELR